MAEKPQAPIAKVTVWGHLPPNVEIYAPGLPPGEHDLYCEPEATAPYLQSDIARDAARYRWLRSADPSTANVELLPTLDLTALDDGIDAAMAVSGRNSTTGA